MQNQPYPYFGGEGFRLLKKRLKDCCVFVHEAIIKKSETYNRDLLEFDVGDRILEMEFCAFLPEICAEHFYKNT